MSPTSLTYGNDPDQVYERYGLPNAERPTVVLIHGGYWRSQHDREHMRRTAEELSNLGWSVVLAEYRRSPHLPAETLQDIDSLLATLAPEHLVLTGFSVGGQLALLCASKHLHIRQVITLAPVTDLVATEHERLGEDAVRDWLHEPASNHPELNPTFSRPISIPIIVFHGTDDARVPISHSRKYVHGRLDLGEDIRLFEIAGAGHFELVDPHHPFFLEFVRELEKIEPLP